MSHIYTWHIHIKGQVQGVGYRPLVYNKAIENGLHGWVSNDANGLHIEINTDEKGVESFIEIITLSALPPLAKITSIHKKVVAFRPFQDFNIIQENTTGNPTETLLAPDIALCSECRNEISQIHDRRYRYGFNTCTNCGPRYSIINKLPYDRVNTEMSNFDMCDSCKNEYTDTSDRRHYSQTNSCETCGVKMSLYTSQKEQIDTDSQSIIENIVKFWNDGKIIAIKGIGGFLLTCDSQNKETVSRLRHLKHRPSKPFALMIPSLDYVTDLTDKEASSLTDSVSPIVLLNAQKVKGEYHEIHDGLDRLGVMIPYAPLFQILLDRFRRPIIATSGNISNSPIVFKNEDAIDSLSHIADYIVTNDRDIVIPQDDSVIQYSEVGQQKIIIRRSRGLAPSYFNSKIQWQKDGILAMGAHLKSTFSILNRHNVYISQYIGDLDHFDTQEHFKHTLDHLTQLLHTQAKEIVVDSHPEYPATVLGEQLAESQSIPVRTVQHHIAHFCALLGEHALQESKDKILGVIWDGTGLGDDGNIWGSEFFTFENGQFDRCAHLDYYPMIGGNKMAREPRLSALAILGDSEIREKLLQKKFTDTEWKVYQKLLKGVSKIQSSSMGRLFDAVSSLLGIKDVQTYEGEAAMLLEVQARRFFRSNNYNTELSGYLVDNQSIRLDSKQLLHSISKDLREGITISEIAAKFHLTLVQWIKKVAISQSCKKIGFSGGVFQNSLLVDLIIMILGSDFELFFHQELSPNDEGISFGQLVYGAMK